MEVVSLTALSIQMQHVDCRLKARHSYLNLFGANCGWLYALAMKAVAIAHYGRSMYADVIAVVIGVYFGQYRVFLVYYMMKAPHQNT